MTLRAIGLGGLGKGLLTIMANTAGCFLAMIFLAHLKIALFHLKDFGMAFVAFHLVRFMTEGYRTRALRSIGYVTPSYLLGLNAGGIKAN